MLKPISTFALIFSIPFYTHAQNLERVQTMGGTEVDFGNTIAVDASGNTYLTGYFSTTIDADPGPGEHLLTSNGARDIFIQKLDPAGNLLWAVGIGGPGGEESGCLALDEAGNIYLSGLFAQTVDFDPGPAISPLSTQSGYEAFALKLDPDGQFVWAKQFSGNNFSLGNQIAIQDNAVYLAGEYKGDMDADPGPGSYILNSINSNWGGFILKLDTDGNFKWAANFNTFNGMALQSVAIAKDGGVVVVGWFTGSVDFDPGSGFANLTSGGQDDIYVLKLDSLGAYQWVQRIGGGGTDVAFDVKTDAAGNVVIGGWFSSTVDFDPGPGVFQLSTPFATAYLLKLSPIGSFIWVAKITGTGYNQINSMAIDASGNIYAGGELNGSADFDPGPGVATYSVNSFQGAFLWKVDFSGQYNWTKVMEGKGIASCVAVDQKGSVYTTGWFSEIVNFDPDASNQQATAQGYYDIYALKFSQENLFEGRIFYDENQNGVQDGSEPGVNGIVFEAVHAKKFAQSNQLGSFYFYDPILGDTVAPKISYPDWTVMPVFAVPDSNHTPMLFAANGPLVKDVCISIVELTPFRPGFFTDIDIQVVNVGMVELDSLLVRMRFVVNTFPDPLEYVSAIPAPFSISSDELKWEVSHLGLFETYTIRVKLRTPPSTGTGMPILISSSVILPDDVNPNNNGSRIEGITVGSFDPNDKQVTPAQVDFSVVDTTDLRYVVRFQNTGTYQADFVVIRDTLSPQFDLSTLRVLAASHAYTWRVFGPRVLEVRFDHINLPDSTSNEPESHGYVAFSIRPKPGLELGDSITNRAGIYFDYNAPVITNTTAMKVVELSGTRQPLAEAWEFTVAPNPGGSGKPSFLHFKQPLSLPTQVVITDGLGRAIFSRMLETGQTVFELPLLPTGAYVVQVRAGERTYGKVLVRI
ncbi:MAG: T9SS type A sorting domain-containing protein [Saprospiraceae bacterium]|nr:T9SS type A sorting domain-containing protein [Saprospiraceae bacterium]